MFYIAVDKPLDKLVKDLKKTFEKNSIKVLSEEEKEGTLSAKATVFTLKYKDKIFKVSVVNLKDKTTVSAIFPKKIFSEEEKDFIKKFLEKVKDENS